MKIVRIFGGLGNQMFQYALALALKAKFSDQQVFIDHSIMRGYPLHNGFELDRVFGVKIPQANYRNLLKVAYPLPNYRLWQIGHHILPKRKSMIIENRDMSFMQNILSDAGDLLYEGYWQTEKYFIDIRDHILEAYKFPKFSKETRNSDLWHRMIDKITVSIHVRRGDYLAISNASSICTLDYYKQAINQLLKRVNPDLYLVFSDDINWCKENLGYLLNSDHTVYVDWNKGADSFQDMHLMSLCKHNIIANSSFSWWGAWLNKNPDKMVIAPSKWMESDAWPDIVPTSWNTVKII